MSLRASIEPTRTAAYAGIPVQATVNVANTAGLVDAFDIRILGVDRDWVRCTPERLQLFPETSGSFELQIDLPDDFPSGMRILTIQIRSELKPEHPTLLTLTLDVDARPRLNVQVHPVQVVGGSKGEFAVTVENLGNTESTARLTMTDPESLVRGIFDRPEIDVPPGEQRSTPLRVTGKRPLAGAPMVRSLSIGVDGGMPGSEQLVTFVQTPRISRLMFSFIGLLVAASIFGIVFSRNLQNVVDATTTDDKVLEQAFGAADPNAGFAPAQMVGTVVARSSKTGIAGATVEVYLTAVPDRPIRSVATAEDGTYIVDNLGPGPFRLRAVAAGYDSRWFGDVAAFENSPDVSLTGGEKREAVDMLLGGQPATVRGVVVGGLVDGASVDLIVPAAVTGGINDAVIGNKPVDETGVFEFTNVPAPGTYTLRVRKTGSITTQLSIQLAGGEVRSGITVQLRAGDGQIDGTIIGPNGPLGAATITVTSPDLTVATLSLTTGTVGSFVVPDLLTPASYSISVSLAGYATKSLTVSLASGQQVNGLNIVLESATGSISGLVKDSTGAALGGIPISASDGENTYSTTSISVDDPTTTTLNEIGTFSLASVPAPGIYTVSIGGNGFAPVVRNVVLGPGNLTIQLNVDLVASTGRVSGRVTDAAGAVGGVTVKVSSGLVTRTTTTASSCPPGITDCIGRYRLDGLAPGAYTITFSRTGSEPAARQIVIVAGGAVTADVVLRPRAGITVYVCTTVTAVSPTGCTGGAKSGYQVRIWKEAAYPGGSPLGALLTSATGAVTFSNLDAPTRYVIEVSAVAGDPPITSRTERNPHCRNRRAMTSGLVRLALPERILAEIGTTTAVRVRLTELGGVDRKLLIRALGNLGGPLPATEVDIGAGASMRTEVAVSIPHGMPPGEHQYLFEVLDRDNGRVLESIDATVDIQHTRSVSMSVQPQSIRKRMRGKVRIVIRNHDEEPHKIRLRAEGDDGDTRVTLERPGVIVRPGEMVRVPARVKVKPYYIGKQKERFYSIIGEGAGVPVYARGNVRQKPMIGKNVKSLALLGSIIIVWLTLTISVIRLVSPATQEAAVGAETGTEQPGAGGETPVSPLIPVLVDVNGTVTAVPDGSGVVVAWRPVALGDATTTEGKVAGGTAVASPDVALQTTTTDTEGKFVVAGLDGAGLFEFTFSKAGHQTQTKIVQPNGQPVTLEIELVPGSGTIGGIAVDEAGRALGAVDITLTDGAITYGSSTPTDGDSAGRFQFNNLSSPGTYVLDARIAGRGLASTTIELQTGQAITDIRLVLRADVTALAGKIASAAFEGDTAAQDFRIAQATATGRLPTFTVTATDGTLTRSTTTLSEGLLAGTFRLEQLPVNRTYTVTYEAPGFLTLTEQLELTTSTPERQIAMVRSTGRLRGKVTIEGSNLSPTAVAVTVANSDNTYKATDAISSDGSLLVDGIVPGRYVVTLEALGLQKQVREVEIGAGTSTTLNVTLSAAKESTIKSSLSFKVVKGGNDTTTQVVATVKNKLQTECGAVGTDKDCVYDVTLADGNLKITGLEAGGYVIEFTAVGFFPRTITTQVAPSTDVAQQEVVMVPLGSLQGQVNDDTAAPVQGITLRLLKGTELVATTTTSATGEYLFSRKLLPTTYTVEVVSSNYSSTPRSVVGALAATLNLDVVVRGLSLITGEVKQLELLKGEFEPYEISDFNIYLRNGMLGATWTDAATLGLSKSLGGYRVGVAPTLNSDDSRITGSTSGYDLCFVAINTAGATISASACDAPVAGLDARIADDIDLKLTETATRSYFVSPTPGRVAGFVTVNGVAAGAGLKVEARRVDSTERVIETVSTKTTAGGAYSFTNLTPVRPIPDPLPGGFSLTSENTHIPPPDGCSTTAGACWIIRASAESTGFVDSKPIQVYPGTNVTISALAIVQTADASLTITVLDQSGSPIQDVTISATANGSSIGACALTDANGQCTITNPTPGVVAQVTAEKAGYRTTKGSIGITPGKLALSLTMSPARSATFTVLDPSSAVLAGVTVSATDALGGRSSCLTAAGTGVCALTGLSPGTAVITAEKTGYSIYSGVLAIASDTDAVSTITMSVGNAGITGLVTTSANVPIQGAVLTATKGTTVFSAISNADGRYRFPGLSAGDWTIGVSAVGYASTTASATVVAGSDTTLNFALTALKGGVEIYVRTSGGSPIEGVTVSAYTNSAKTTLVTQGLSVNGLVTLSDLEAGQYWIVVTDGLNRFAAQEFLVNVDRGYTTQLPVYLGSTKSVVVIGVAGIPAVGFGPQSTISATIGLESGGTIVTTSAVAAFDRSVATFSEIANGTYNVLVDGQASRVVIGGKTYDIPDKDVTVSGPTTVDVGLLLLTVAPVAVNVTTSAGATVTLDGGYLLTPTSATANGSGSATFASVPPGTYRATVSKTGFTTVTQDITVTDMSANGGAFSQTITLTDVAPVAVTITAKSGADLVPGASIRAGSTGDICVTNNLGVCTLLLPPATYSITASHPSYDDVTSAGVVVVASTPQSINIAFPTPGVGSVAFVTKDTANVDLDNVAVTSTSDSTSTCTTASGKCTIASQATRSTTYRLTKTGYADTFVAATPIASSTVTVSAQLPAVSTSASLNVRVVDGVTGANISGVAVSNINDPATPVAFCTTDASGCTVVPSANFGTLTLRAAATGYATTSATVTVTRETATAVVIVVQPNVGSVEVTANVSGGGALSGASVSAAGGGSCTTNGSGKCTISNLSGGAATLTVSSPNYTTVTVVAGLAPGSTTSASVTLQQTGTVRISVASSPATSATFAIVGFGTLCTISNPATTCDGSSAVPFGTWLVSGTGYSNSSVSISASTLYTVTMSATP